MSVQFCFPLGPLPEPVGLIFDQPLQTVSFILRYLRSLARLVLEVHESLLQLTNSLVLPAVKCVQIIQFTAPLSQLFFHRFLFVFLLPKPFSQISVGFSLCSQCESGLVEVLVDFAQASSHRGVLIVHSVV